MDKNRISVIVPQEGLIPMQFRRNSVLVNPLTKIEVFNLEDNLLEDISHMSSQWSVYALANGYDYIQYLYGINLSSNWGYCYFKITAADNSYWVSELMCVKALSDLSFTAMRFQWFSECDVDNIYYQENYKNILYMDSFLLHPENDEFRDNEKLNQSTGFKTFDYGMNAKVWKFQHVLPEYVVDSLRAAWMLEELTFWNIFGDQSEIKEFKIDADWQDTSPVAIVTGTFKTDAVLFAPGCCNKLALACCYEEVEAVEEYYNDWPVGPCAPGTRALINNGTEILLYTCDGGSWVALDADNTDCKFVQDSPTSNYYYWTGTGYENFGTNNPPYIATAVMSGTDLDITGIVVPGSLVQLQVETSPGTWEDWCNPVQWTQFAIDGISCDTELYTLPPSPFNVRIHNYNFSCNYNYSNVVAVTY